MIVVCRFVEMGYYSLFNVMMVMLIMVMAVVPTVQLKVVGFALEVLMHLLLLVNLKLIMEHIRL